MREVVLRLLRVRRHAPADVGLKEIRPIARPTQERAGAFGGPERLWVLHAEQRVEVAHDGEAACVEHGSAGPFALLVAAILAEREVTAVGLDGRHGGARTEDGVDLADLLVEGYVVVVAALIPGPEPPPFRRRLAPGARREPLQRVEGVRPGEDGVGQGARLDLDAPAALGLGAEPSVAHLVALDQQPEAAVESTQGIG